MLGGEVESQSDSGLRGVGARDSDVHIQGSPGRIRCNIAPLDVLRTHTINGK